MAEKAILVCDTCGKPAAETVTIKVARGNFVKDLCASHVNELVAGARRPRRGRPKAVVVGSAPKRTAARKKPAARKAAARKAAARKAAARKTTTPKRRGRPRKAPA
jgi:topoisomerase IA-like protein